MMPEYGMGFWQCKLRYWNQEQLLEVAREYKKRNIPIDVIVCDFSTGRKWVISVLTRNFSRIRTLWSGS